MKVLDSQDFLAALLSAKRPGVEKILAFCDWRAGAICTDGRLLLIPLDDHICHRGDGIFESLAFRQGKLFALDAHLERMWEGAQALAIVPPLSMREARELVCEVAGISGREHGDVRIFLSRGPGGFGVSPAECPLPGFYIVALAAKEPAPDLYTQGLTAFTSSYPPKQEYLAKIKSVNYLPNVLMAAEAIARADDVAITFDAAGNMGEAAIANIAIVDKDGVFRSPETQNILPGTTLLCALELAAEKMPVRIAPIHHSEIAAAREMLLLTSATLCVPITKFDNRAVGDGKPGPVAAWLEKALLEYMLAAGTPIGHEGTGHGRS